MFCLRRACFWKSEARLHAGVLDGRREEQEAQRQLEESLRQQVRELRDLSGRREAKTSAVAREAAAVAAEARHQVAALQQQLLEVREQALQPGVRDPEVAIDELFSKCRALGLEQQRLEQHVQVLGGLPPSKAVLPVRLECMSAVPCPVFHVKELTDEVDEVRTNVYATAERREEAAMSPQPQTAASEAHLASLGAV